MTRTIGAGVTGSNINATGLAVSISELTDTANIEEAFKTYHLGTSAGRDTNPDDNSVAGHLNYLYSKVSSLPPTPVYLTGTENISTGAVYYIDGQTTPTGTSVFYVTGTPTNTSFPKVYDSNSRFPGILTVYRTKIDNSTAHVYQYYEMTMTSQQTTQLGVDSQRAAIFWRSALITVGTAPTAASWTDWVQAASQESISLIKSRLGSATASDISYITGIGTTSPGATLAQKITLMDTATNNAATTAGNALPKSDNLASLANIATARSNLGIFNFQTTSGGNPSPFSGKVYVADPAVVGNTGASIKNAVAGDLWFW